MFPIHSVSGRVLGFGGRTLITDKKIAKYFNSPESIIYNKSEILYGLHFAKGDIIKYDNCFLCEGYTDVISLHQAGLINVVASSGTSLTKDQIKLIRRYTQNITILYDGDSAGIKASFRGIDLILEEGMNVKVVLFPDGEDPDSFAKKSNTTELESYISEHTQDFISFKANILLKDGESDPLKRAELIREIVHSVSLIPDQITRSIYQQQIAQLFNISEQVVTNEMIKLRKNVLAKQLQEPEVKDLPIDLPVIDDKQSVLRHDTEHHFNERELIRVMVKYGVYELRIPQEEGKDDLKTSVIEMICHELERDEMAFSHPLYNKIHQLFLDGLNEKTLYSTSFLRRIEDQEIVQFVTDIESNEHELSHRWMKDFNISTLGESDKLEQAVIKAVYGFKAAKIEERINQIRKRLEEEISDEEIMDLLSEQIIYEQAKKTITGFLGRTILR